MIAAFGDVGEKVAQQCPCAYAHVASLVAFAQVAEEPVNSEVALYFLDVSQGFLRRYQEKNNFTFANILCPGFA